MSIPSPLKSIRAKCLDCNLGNAAEVRNCHIETCPLHPYRMGHYPKGMFPGRHIPASWHSVKKTLEE